MSSSDTVEFESYIPLHSITIILNFDIQNEPMPSCAHLEVPNMPASPEMEVPNMPASPEMEVPNMDSSGNNDDNDGFGDYEEDNPNIGPDQNLQLSVPIENYIGDIDNLDDCQSLGMTNLRYRSIICTIYWNPRTLTGSPKH